MQEMSTIIFNEICKSLGFEDQIHAITPIAGGDTCRVYRLETGELSLFVKLRAKHDSTVFSEESRSLNAIAATGCVPVPQVLGHGSLGDVSWLALEWLSLNAGDERCGALLGLKLAELHKVTSDSYGWEASNFIGANRQSNSVSKDWTTFFVEQRLKPQIRMLRLRNIDNDLSMSLGRVLDATTTLLARHCPEPSMLHGDMWGGNWARLSNGDPVIFDPASYWGDRETDLAMTALFGGFPATFYAAYDEAWPLPKGWVQRRPVYQLYHVLNHVTLFGGSYVSQASTMVREICEEAGGPLMA